MTAKNELGAARQAADEAQSSLNASKSKGTLITSLMRQNETGKLKGICVRFRILL